METSRWIMDGNESNFEEVALRPSYEQLVVVDFWAPWCGPCRVLKPILERLAAEYGGKFRLVKVNSDENPTLAARYGVRGIPNVKALREGAVVDEFTGALPEREVRRWLERLIPSPAEPLWREAEAALTAGDRATAMAKLQEALSRDPAFDRARLRRIELLLEARQVAEARADFAALGDKTSEAARRLESRLALLDEEATGSLTALAEQVAANPKNWEARYRLARGYAAEGRFAEALEMALAIVEGNRQWNEDAARKLMLQIFEAMQPDDPVVREYRVRLANALNR